MPHGIYYIDQFPLTEQSYHSQKSLLDRQWTKLGRFVEDVCL